MPVNPLLPEQPQPVYPNGSSQPTQNAQPNQSNALPNTGKVMQNHPFASTMIILSLIGLGLVLITFNRRKKIISSIKDVSCLSSK
ncbi:LPXTG cell wall anchor domain-containing protein [Staphylococcus agnetis]|uniref:LPXTG cell wall anchor domain-containing protein n=2 Tax=Staphylococcus TaxID=1279 RepID=UPI000D02E3C8|nr:LPXTG cell wall anchor domain-containing protein [Staphylococcus agnetis]